MPAWILFTTGDNLTEAKVVLFQLLSLGVDVVLSPLVYVPEFGTNISVWTKLTGKISLVPSRITHKEGTSGIWQFLFPMGSDQWALIDDVIYLRCKVVHTTHDTCLRIIPHNIRIFLCGRDVLIIVNKPTAVFQTACVYLWKTMWMNREFSVINAENSVMHWLHSYHSHSYGCLHSYIHWT